MGAIKYTEISKDYCSFDIALALYHWLQHNWNGRDDELYSAFCKLTSPGMYKPSYSETYFENIEDEPYTIYNELTMFNYQDALARVLNYESQ